MVEVGRDESTPGTQSRRCEFALYLHRHPLRVCEVQLDHRVLDVLVAEGVWDAGATCDNAGEARYPLATPGCEDSGGRIVT